jgi:hypothetical protein
MRCAAAVDRLVGKPALTAAAIKRRFRLATGFWLGTGSHRRETGTKLWKLRAAAILADSTATRVGRPKLATS